MSSIINIAKDIKNKHLNDVAFYKVGAFVQLFGKDAYIISYLFDYNLKEIKENIPTCGFPKRAISKVCAKLEQKKINYIIVDTKKNYEVNEKFDNKNLNEYNEILEKAKRYIKVRKRLKSVKEELLKQTEEENIMEKIRRIEEIAYENRKI